MVYLWEMTGQKLEPVTVTADSFDEAIAKARKINAFYCCGRVIGKEVKQNGTNR